MAGRNAGKKGITVCFEDEEMARLEELARCYQVSSATILRWALRALAEYVRHKGGKLVLPLDFSELDCKETGYAEASRRVLAQQRVAEGEGKGEARLQDARLQDARRKS